MHEERLTAAIAGVKGGHRIVEAEEPVQRQGPLPALAADCQLAPQGGVVGIADGRDDRQSVQGSAKDDHE